MGSSPSNSHNICLSIYIYIRFESYLASNIFRIISSFNLSDKSGYVVYASYNVVRNNYLNFVRKVSKFIKNVLDMSQCIIILGTLVFSLNILRFILRNQDLPIPSGPHNINKFD